MTDNDATAGEQVTEQVAASQLEHDERPASRTTTEERARRDLQEDPRVQTLVERVTTKLTSYTRQYEAKYAQLTERATRTPYTAMAGPSPPLPVPYLWFDLMVMGPFEPIAPNGPFIAHRIIRAGEPALLLAVLWRNPVSLLGGPSAAQIMSPFQYVVRGRTLDLNSVTSGPVLGPITNMFGGGFINMEVLPVVPIPAPSRAEPRMLEIHVTVDMLGPGPGLPPFAGFATRWFQPDLQPPFLGQPGILPGFLEETPVRVLVYS
ncbi:hypothetical protein GCM10022251_35600 [Phytohabitans flavus]|uniref:Uncharacterized protein n=1 Tax=Phytohabitans flavus TaxID=1076124 RepID=A0A6F8XMM1_9ACTN|nr:hypothetical protein [Phytohabitans flavus]BCB75074.1 hypothetical protein Pflav_014840 [Phytohabitans flavus]